MKYKSPFFFTEVYTIIQVPIQSCHYFYHHGNDTLLFKYRSMTSCCPLSLPYSFLWLLFIPKRVDLQESPVLTLSLHYTCAQFFASHAHSQRVHSAAAGSLTTALYSTARSGQWGTTPLFTNLRSSRPCGLCTHKSTADGSYRTYIIFTRTARRFFIGK